MNATNEGFVAEWNAKLYHVSVMGTINFCGFLFTCLTLALTFTTELKVQNVRYLFANLVLACLLHTFMFTIPQNMFVLYRQQLPEKGCQWLGIIFFALGVQMIVFPPFLTVNRYIGLNDAELYKRLFTPRRTLIMITGSWIFSVLIASTFRIGGKSGYDFDNGHCCIVVKESLPWTIYYCFVILVPLVCVSDGIMVFCNFRIYQMLRAHGVARSLCKNVVSENRQILYFLIAETLIPLCFHTIYHLAKVFYIDRQSNAMILFLPAFYSTNAIARCLSILIFVRPYRRAFRAMFTCKRAPTVIQDPSKTAESVRLLGEERTHEKL